MAVHRPPVISQALYERAASARALHDAIARYVRAMYFVEPAAGQLSELYFTVCDGAQKMFEECDNG